MIATTLNSVASYLVTEEPDWNTQVKGDFTLLTSTTESSTRRQERLALSSTLRTALKWTSFQEYGAAATTLSSFHAMGLTGVGGSWAPYQPILCPFWPGMVSYGTSSPYSAYYSIIWEPGFTTWQIYVTTAGIGSYTPTASSMVAPLLIGIFDKLQKVTAESDQDISIEFQFTENGAAAYALTVSASVPTGPAWQTSPAWPIFPEIPQHSAVESGEVDIKITRKQIGYTRDQAQTVYPQTPNRIIKSDFIPTDGTGSTLLALFLQSLGDVKPFWVPAAFTPCQLTADLTSGAVLTVDNAAALDSQAHLFLYGQTWAAQQIINEVGNTITLANAPGTFYAASTYVQPLLFAHFTGPAISITWTDPNLCTTTLQFEELPPEYGLPSGEAYGQTLGPLGTLAYIYTFTDGIGTWRYTSSEASISYGGNTYLSQHMNHGTITERINLADSSTDITLRYFTPNPFTRYRTPRLQMAMNVTIQSVLTVPGRYLVDSRGAYLVDSRGAYIIAAPPAANATTIFLGKMKVAKYDNSSIVLTCGGPTSLFDRMIPRPLVQLQCNNCLFDSQCGLSRAQWTFSATMPTPPSPGAPFQYTINAISWPQGALPSLPAHYFAFGYIVRTLADGTQQGALIMDSAAISGGSIVLTLNGDLSPFPTGSESWAVVPNCAGRYVEDCQTKFSNQGQFSGFPFMPITDPNVLPSTLVVPSSSKK